MAAGQPPVPKYWNVVEHVQNLITSDGLAPGAPLPSELELQRILGVSRGTVRKALDELTVAGLVERRSGVGTFVAPRRMPRALPELTTFSEHVRSIGMDPGTKILSHRVLPERNDFTDDFPGGTTLVEWVRLRFVDGEPVGLHHLVLPEGISKRIRIDDPQLTSSLYERIEAVGIEIDTAQEHIVARVAVQSEAQALGIRTGTPILDVRRKTFNTSGAVVEVVQAVYRGDRYRYTILLERRPQGANADGAKPQIMLATDH